MAEIDVWQGIQNWGLFLAVAGGVAWYYSQTQRQRPATTRATPQPTQGAVAPKQQPTKKEPKKTKSFEKKAGGAVTAAAEALREQNNVANSPPSKSKDVSEDDFVKGMLKARQGISVKTSDKGKNDRVRTVKPKGSLPVLQPGVGQGDRDDASWSPVVSPLPKVSGVDDMLEPATQGPSSLRITASQTPAKEKVARQPKKEVVETKKQRQNRQKVEQQRVQRLEEEGARKALEEKQRRAAREARGEPAKNGVQNAPAPANNAWSPSVSAQAPQQPVQSNNASLLDTFDAESTSSSNDAHASTAATSTTDGVPSQWADEPVDERLAEALKDSEVWEEVPSKSKQKSRTTRHDFNGSLTPAGAPIIVNGSNNGSKGKSAVGAKANGFSALSVEDDE